MEPCGWLWQFWQSLISSCCAAPRGGTPVPLARSDSFIPVDTEALDATTRERAVEKMEAVINKIGHPEVWKDYDALSARAAKVVASQIRRKPDSVIGFATGSTPLGLYKRLIRNHEERGLDFSKVTTFNLDEYVGLPPYHDQSYHYFMWENLFDHINVTPANVYIPDGTVEDVAYHCEWYEQQIAQAGGIDLQILGIGANGHMAFNEPGSSLGSRTRIKTLTEKTVRDNARYLRSVRPVDPEEIYEYVDGQPHPAVVRQVLREEAFDLGLVERDDGTFVPVDDGPVAVDFDGVEALPGEYGERLDDLLTERYGPDWARGESGEALRETVRRLKADYFERQGADVDYDADTALAYALYHLPGTYAAAAYALAELARDDLLPRQLRVLDVGAGVGGPALAALDLLPDDCLLEYHAVEPSAAADVFGELVAPGRNRSVELHLGGHEDEHAVLRKRRVERDERLVFELRILGEVGIDEFRVLLGGLREGLDDDTLRQCAHGRELCAVAPVDEDEAVRV